MAAAVELAAVQHEGQPRLDLDQQVVGQVRQEGQVQRDPAQFMAALHRPVVERDFTCGQAQVEQREARRLGGRLRRGPHEALQQIVDVVVAGRGPRQAQLRGVDVDRLDHRRQAQQGARIEIHEHTFDLQLRRGRRAAGRGTDRQAAQRERQCRRREAQFVHSQLAPEQLRTACLELPLQQRRQCQPGQRQEQQQGRQDPQQHPQRTRLQHITPSALEPTALHCPAGMRSAPAAGSSTIVAVRLAPITRDLTPCRMTCCCNSGWKAGNRRWPRCCCRRCRCCC